MSNRAPSLEATERPEPAHSEVEVRVALEDILRRRNPKLGRVVRFDSKPCVDRTSFDLVDLAISFDDGTVLRLLLKDLGMKNLHEIARRVKPDFLYNPLREIMTYQEILAPNRLDTAHFHGAVIKPDDDRYWLFLEKVPGLRLCQVSDYSAWLQAARWLARFHARFAGETENLNGLVPLVRYDAAYYRLWLDRVERFRSIRLGRTIREALAGQYERAIERLIGLPSTVIHGEFYASNILVEKTRGGCRIRPVDWETAAAGPGLVDLAALTSGAWTERERTEMAAAYRDTLLAEGTTDWPLDDLLVALDDCRLHLAIRWSGWAADWTPPPENAYDWLAEAIALGETMSTKHRKPSG